MYDEYENYNNQFFGYGYNEEGEDGDDSTRSTGDKNYQ